MRPTSRAPAPVPSTARTPRRPPGRQSSCKACHWGEPGQLRVCHALGNKDRGEDHARHQVRPQPLALVVAQGHQTRRPAPHEGTHLYLRPSATGTRQTVQGAALRRVPRWAVPPSTSTSGGGSGQPAAAPHAQPGRMARGTITMRPNGVRCVPSDVFNETCSMMGLILMTSFHHLVPACAQLGPTVGAGDRGFGQPLARPMDGSAGRLLECT